MWKPYGGVDMVNEVSKAKKRNSLWTLVHVNNERYIIQSGYKGEGLQLHRHCLTVWTTGNTLTTTPCNYRHGSNIHIRKYETEDPVSQWGEWSQCSAQTCMKRRERQCEAYDINACSAPLEEYIECSTEQVCTWSAWSSWNACDVETGRAQRQRPMVNICAKSSHPLGKQRCTGNTDALTNKPLLILGQDMIKRKLLVLIYAERRNGVSGNKVISFLGTAG